LSISENGTNLGRRIGSMKCKLLGEDNKRSVTMQDGDDNERDNNTHACCNNGKTSGRPRGK
jgi:hypothetical protein